MDQPTDAQSTVPLDRLAGRLAAAAAGWMSDESTVSRVRVLSPCGHPLEDARNVGTPSWQNKWQCQTCGHVWSR